MSEENKAMVRRMVEAINSGDEEIFVDKMFAMFTMFKPAISQTPLI